MDNQKLYSKYRFRGLPLLVLGNDNKFYRLSYEKNLRNYEAKELIPKEHNGKKKLLYLNDRYAKNKLEPLKEPCVVFIKDLIMSDSDILIAQIEAIKTPLNFLV